MKVTAATVRKRCAMATDSIWWPPSLPIHMIFLIIPLRYLNLSNQESNIILDWSHHWGCVLWGSDSWYCGQRSGMWVLFSEAAPCWVSLESQWSDWKDPHSAQRSAKGYHDIGRTIGMVSAFPFILRAQRRIGFINTYGLKKISKAILTGTVLLKRDCYSIVYMTWTQV